MWGGVYSQPIPQDICAAGEFRARLFKAASAVTSLKNLQQGITKQDTRVMNS